MSMRIRILSLILLALLVIPVITGQYTALAAEKEISVYVNDQKVIFVDAKPYIQNSRTLVPVRFVSETLGAEVYWTQSTSTVTIIKGNDTIKLRIGGTTITKNGVLSEMDVAPVISNGRTMVPLRFVSENLGVGVEWDQNAYAVYITTTKEPGNVVVVPPTASELDKLIQEMAKVNSSVGNLYNGDQEETRDFITDLNTISSYLGATSEEFGTAYKGDNGGNTTVIVNDEYSGSDLLIIQRDRNKLSYDVTWAALDYLFSTEDATKIWYMMAEVLSNEKNNIFKPINGSITGYSYEVYLKSPSYIYIEFSKN